MKPFNECSRYLIHGYKNILLCCILCSKYLLAVALRHLTFMKKTKKHLSWLIKLIWFIIQTWLGAMLTQNDAEKLGFLWCGKQFCQSWSYSNKSCPHKSFDLYWVLDPPNPLFGRIEVPGRLEMLIWMGRVKFVASEGANMKNGCLVFMLEFELECNV